MSRKSLLLVTTLALLLTGAASSALLLLVRHEPEDYRRAFVPPGPERTRHSREATSGFTRLASAFHAGSGLWPASPLEAEWDIRLTDEQINSYFAEDFKRSNVEKILPEDVSEPRVLLEPNKLRLAFRYGHGLWSSIISLDFGVWLTEEPNVVAVEVQGLHAGSLPVGAQFFLDKLSDLAEHGGIQVQWYRHDGNAVALLHFQGSQPETAVQLQMLQIVKGGIILRGRPLDSGSARAAALPTPRPSAGN